MNEIQKTDSIILNKSYSFALAIIKLYKSLNEEKEYVLSKQILRSGTSVDANVNEAISSESKKDFIHKLGIALKKARETSYGLRLLKDSSYLNGDAFISIHHQCSEIIKILSSIILTTRERYSIN